MWAALAVAVLLAAAATGCGPNRLYAGPPRPRDQIAVVEGVDTTKTSWRVVEVDGKRFSVFASQKFELEPGRHRIAIVFREERWGSIAIESAEPCDVDLMAEAGHHYMVEVRSQRLGGVWMGQVYLQDRDTRQKIACVPRQPVEWELDPTGRPRPVEP